MSTYTEFLRTKTRSHVAQGIIVPDGAIHP